jgi:membrane protein implicated in regulation of membrane protease activity
MFMKHTGLVVIFLALLALPDMALAYIGPGAGITFIGALIGLVLAVLSAVSFILFWPVRRVWRRMKAKKENIEAAECQDALPAKEDPEREGAPVEN